jgi:hypothetical protein
MHYVLHEIETGDLLKVSEEPFTMAEVTLGKAVEFFDTPLPDLEKYHWNPKFLMWRKT